MRRISILVFSLLVFSSAFLGADQARLSQFNEQLGAITDSSLRQTLQNSIIAGLIESQHDFDLAVSQAEAAANHNNLYYYSAYGSDRNRSDVVNEISKLAAPITGLDRDAVKIVKNPGYKQGESLLFKDLGSAFPPSYAAAAELCYKFNPKKGTNDASRLDEDIDNFLETIKNDPVIKHALSCTNSTMQDLKKNWFGSGLGFEHVVAGELSGSKVGGYHWWYKFYNDERLGNTEIKASSGDIGDPKAFTGSFYWDPDDSGPLPRAYKPVGGFLIGNSVQAMLALGHIAMETCRKSGSIPSALKFNASINGEEFSWQMYTMNGSLRSLYPLKGSRTSVNPDRAGEDYYEHEKSLIDSDCSGEILH
ncbi:MAG: hypothetical protein KKB51_02515 [Candidatus Riflebacteria bacterium]|nr:hypothetical protein [Candidatus Riflebacteria bacterium]